MLTRFTLKFIGSFLTLLLTSMVFGNIILLHLSLVPLLLIIFSLVIEIPKDIKVVRNDNRISIWINEVAEISGKIEVKKGVGIVTMADVVPEHFELVEGNNFRIYWKGLKCLSENFRYSIKCTKRGVYQIGPLNYESRHFANFEQNAICTDTQHVELEVRPKPINIKRMRDPKIFSRIPMPLGSVAKLGIMTTDFKEIRDYYPGDSYRHINWKATARLSNSLHPWPLVNEFEREGKKVVWIFLDSSQLMAIGSSIENAFEYALQAVSGLSKFYLARNCNVGLYVYNDQGKLIFPDAGRRQEYKISRDILKMEISSTNEPLKSAVEKCKGHFIGVNPFFIVITTVRQKNLQELLDGIKELQKYSSIAGARGRLPQILILHITGYSIAAGNTYEKLGAMMLEMRNQHAIRALRRAGAFVASWDPKRKSLANLMVFGVKRR